MVLLAHRAVEADVRFACLTSVWRDEAAGAQAATARAGDRALSLVPGGGEGGGEGSWEGGREGGWEGSGGPGFPPTPDGPQATHRPGRQVRDAPLDAAQPRAGVVVHSWRQEAAAPHHLPAAARQVSDDVRPHPELQTLRLRHFRLGPDNWLRLRHVNDGVTVVVVVVVVVVIAVPHDRVFI